MNALVGAANVDEVVVGTIARIKVIVCHFMVYLELVTLLMARRSALEAALGALLHLDWLVLLLVLHAASHCRVVFSKLRLTHGDLYEVRVALLVVVRCLLIHSCA